MINPVQWLRRHRPSPADLKKRHNIILALGSAVMAVVAIGGKLNMVSTTIGILGGLAGGLLIGLLQRPNENTRTPMEYGVFAALYAFAVFMILALAYNIIITDRYDVTIVAMRYAPTEFISQVYVYGIWESVRGLLFLVTYVIGAGFGGWFGERIMDLVFPSRTIWTPAWKERSHRIEKEREERSDE